MQVGHVGIGWYGSHDVSVGIPTAATPAVAVPAVGVRYWATPTLGIDAALGFSTTSSSSKTDPGGTTTDGPSRTAFLLHGGVPIVLGGSQHFSVQVTPELEVGFGSGSIKPPPGSMAPTTDLSGFLLQAGARAGAELYFGFIGVPQLSLDASVGLFLRSTSAKTSAGNASTKNSELLISTSAINNPWDIFRSNVAARYYF
jgi:hypothetical protein